MKAARHKTIIIMLVLILLAGVYPESCKVYPAIVQKAGVLSESRIVSTSPVFGDIQECEPRMLEQLGEKAFEQSILCIAHIKGNIGKIPYFLSQIVICMLEGRYYSDLEVIQFHSKNQDKSIIIYLHKADGKKESYYSYCLQISNTVFDMFRKGVIII